MPIDRVTHYNPSETYGASRCGRKLAVIKWSRDKADVTCNNCLRSMK